MNIFGNPIPNPLDAIEDKAEIDKILNDANFDVRLSRGGGGRARSVKSIFLP